MKNENHPELVESDENLDPISGAHGAHPVGTGVGAVSGGAAGAAAGSIGGPIGAAVGLVAGAVLGGLAGKGVAEQIDPTVEDAYWRANYTTRPYVDRNSAYETYEAAYRTGYEGRRRNTDRSYDEVESELQREYIATGGVSRLDWDHARDAVRDGWNRVDADLPGDPVLRGR